LPNQLPPVYWVNIMERDDWLVINFEGRKLGLIVSVTEGGKAYLTIAGYHTGESRFIGEKRNVLSVKVEPIPNNLHSSFVPLVNEALPLQLKELPIFFLDVR
jgi:hypothetical protein